MDLNINKCHAITFTRGREHNAYTYDIQDAPLTTVNSIKALGVTLTFIHILIP